jgi:PleD family two-component response regulator
MFKKKKTFLILCSDYLRTKWLKKHLVEKYNLLIAKTPEDAIEFTKNTLTNYIIIDSLIENIDVLDLCKKLRRNTFSSQATIILITDKLKKDFRKKAKFAGVSGFLNDDLNDEELLFQIEQANKGKISRNKVDYISKINPLHKKK